MFGAKYSRLKYWIISIILLIVSAFCMGMGKDLEKSNAFQAAIICYSITFILSLCWINTLANRIRDCGSNPWLSLLGLLPFANLILGIYYGIENRKNQLFKNNDKESSNNDVSLSKAIYNHAKDLSSEIKPAINEYKERHSDSINSNSNNFLNEDEIYEKVLLEIEEDIKVKSSWAKALAQSDGNDKKAESIYIKERVSSILNEQNISNQSNHISNNSYTENIENSQNKSSNAKLITGLIVSIIILSGLSLAIGGAFYYKIQSDAVQQVTDSKANVQTYNTLNVDTEIEKPKNNNVLFQQISEDKNWKIDNHVGDYYLGDTSTQLIYIEEINPLNNKIEEGKQYITNIVKLDLTNNNKVTLLNGCSKPSFRGSECVYSNPILLNDDRTLYYQKDQWVVSDGIYKLDLITLENKFITDGNGFQIINDGKYTNYLVVNKHKYLKGGGSYDSNFLISPEGKEISAVTNPESYSYYKSKVIKQNNEFMNLVQNLLYEWDKAHNNKDLNTFNLIYDENLNYYNKKEIKKSLIMEDKKRLLNKFLNFHQSSKLLKIENLEKNIYKVNYEKNVTYGDQRKTFFSYLVIKIINNNPIIIEEND